MPIEITGEDVLALPMHPNDSGAETIRGYLVALLAEVWNEGDQFSGKRPFGNSGWETDLYIPLIEAELIAGSFDDHGYPEDYDSTNGDHLILLAITALGREPADTGDRG